MHETHFRVGRFRVSRCLATAGPVAAKLGSPVLLVPSSAGLPAGVRTQLQRLAPERVVIVGGTKAVTSDTESEIRSLRG